MSSNKSKTLLQLLQQHQQTDNHEKILVDNGDSFNKLHQGLLQLYTQCRHLIQQSKDQVFIRSNQSFLIQELICQCLQVNLEPDPFAILANIQKMFEAVLNDKINLELQLKKYQEDEISSYEQSLQKLEAEIRQHIRIEQQLKLYAENTQQKYDDLAKLKEETENNYKVKRVQLIFIKKELEAQLNVIKNFEQQGNNKLVTNQSKPILINLQLDKLNRTMERVQTEPQEKEKQGSQQKLKTNHNYNNRVQTEMSEQEKKRKSQLIQYQCSALSYIDSQIKKNNKTRNPSNGGDLKKKSYHQVNKSHDSSYYHLLKQRQEQPKSKRYSLAMNSLKQSNNSVHSFRKKNLNSSSINNTLDITRPFSSIEQHSEDLIQESSEIEKHLKSQDYYQKINEYCENKQHIKKLLSHYKGKYSNENHPPKTKNYNREIQKKMTNYSSKPIF